jgi:Lrp/AsnC family leucine-responsive transcriptional regulator
VIERRVTLLDPKKVGLTTTALIQISMDRHTPERFAKFEAAVKKHPEVQKCFLVTGQTADYLLIVVVPDMDTYQEFLLEKITRIEGVTGVHTSFVMRRVVDTTALPLEYVAPG